MYTVHFSNISEIRMGSPYNGADVEISGEFVPDLGEYTFQDKYLLSEDKKTCYIIQWDSPGNEPGFRVWKLSETNKSLSKSERFSGCCEEIRLEQNQIFVAVWTYDSESKNSKTETIEVKDFN